MYHLDVLNLKLIKFPFSKKNYFFASIWKSSWLKGQAPMDIFSDLYKLAWRKNRVVRDELVNRSWTRGLWRMNTIEELSSFARLWDYAQNILFSIAVLHVRCGIEFLCGLVV